MRRHFILFCALFFYSCFLTGQVINIENKRFLNDTNGWVGNTDFTFNVIQNVSQVVSFGNTTRVQYQKNRSKILFLNDANFIRAGGTSFENWGYQHLRYSYKVANPLTFEAFTQTQYNPVLKLDFRYLIGAGPRIKLLKKPNARIYAAALYMYEYDDITEGGPRFYEHRISSYLTFTFSLFKTVELTSTTFYQPKLGDSRDYRIANDSALEIHMNKYLNYKCGFNLLYDTRQPTGVPDLVYSLKNGLSVKF